MGRKYFGLCSGNLLGTSLRYMRYIYAKENNYILIQYNFEMLVKYLDGIIPLMKLRDNIPSFSVSMDASNVSENLSLTTTHKSIIDGVHQNHIISIEVLD